MMVLHYMVSLLVTITSVSCSRCWSVNATTCMPGHVTIHVRKLNPDNKMYLEPVIRYHDLLVSYAAL